MISDIKRKMFSIFFFLGGVFYMIMFAISFLRRDLVDTIFSAVLGTIIFFISFYVLYEKGDT